MQSSGPANNGEADDLEPLDIGNGLEAADDVLDAAAAGFLTQQWNNSRAYAPKQYCRSLQQGRQRGAATANYDSTAVVWGGPRAAFMRQYYNRQTHSDQSRSQTALSALGSTGQFLSCHASMLTTPDNLGAHAIGLSRLPLSAISDGSDDLEPLPVNLQSTPNHSVVNMGDETFPASLPKPEEAQRMLKKEEQRIEGARTESLPNKSSQRAKPEHRARRRSTSFSLFPNRLYEMLDNAENCSFDHIVSFTPSGTSFQIHDRKRFETEIMPHWFHKMSSFNSFHRQLNFYSFRRENNASIDCCIFSHGQFRRGDKQELKRMKRK